MAGGDRAAILEPGRQVGGERAGEQVLPGRDRDRVAAGEACDQRRLLGRFQVPRGPRGRRTGRRLMAARSRGWPRPSDSRPSARAMSGAPRSAPRNAVAAPGSAASQLPALLSAGDRRRVGERRCDPARQHPAAGSGQRVIGWRRTGCACRRRRGRAAGPGWRGWPGPCPAWRGRPARCRTRQARRRAGLGVAGRSRAPVSGGHRLGIVEAAEGVQAGRAEGFREAGAGCGERRRRRRPAARVLARTRRARCPVRRPGSPPDRAGRAARRACRGSAQAVSNRPVEMSIHAAPSMVRPDAARGTAA